MKRQAGPSNKSFCVAWVFLCLFLFPTESRSEIYKYVDKEGIVHFTNVPTQQEYRKVSKASKGKGTVSSSYLKHVPQGSQGRVKVFRRKISIPSLYFPTSFPSTFRYSPKPGEHRYDPYIQAVCLKHGIDHHLVKAIIKAESAFNPVAVSPKGAMGLMQLMPDTSRDMGVTNPFDPLENIEGGVRYLKRMLSRFNNNLTLALAAYNAGPNAVERHGGIPPYDETRTYILRVMRYYSLYQ